jgi:mycothiol synthase
MYRQIGLGTTLYEALQKELVQRSAAGQLALMMQSQQSGGVQFLTARNFDYSFSEATLEAKAENSNWSDEVTIRPYEALDEMNLIEVFCKAFGDEEQEALDLIQYNTSHEELQVWVAELDGKVVGTVTTRQENSAQWITALAVHPDAEGRGVGRALIYAVKQLAFDQGDHFVKLDVELENERALTIYQKTGFLKVAQIDYFAKTL